MDFATSTDFQENTNDCYIILPKTARCNLKFGLKGKTFSNDYSNYPIYVTNLTNKNNLYKEGQIVSFASIKQNHQQKILNNDKLSENRQVYYKSFRYSENFNDKLNEDPFKITKIAFPSDFIKTSHKRSETSSISEILKNFYTKKKLLKNIKFMRKELIPQTKASGNSKTFSPTSGLQIKGKLKNISRRNNLKSSF